MAMKASWIAPYFWFSDMAMAPALRLGSRRSSNGFSVENTTLDDPSTWSRPWTLMIPLKKTGEAMFEFACHEGNYAMPAILRGARTQELGR